MPVLGFRHDNYTANTKFFKLMISMILTKFGPPFLLVILGAGIGSFIQVKGNYKKLASCPDCVCPRCPDPPTVSVQPFDVEKIKNLKAFTYSPGFTGSISVAGVDSTSIKRYIDAAVLNAFEKHVVKTDKK